MTTTASGKKTKAIKKESNIFSRCMKAPFNILIKLRNLYLQSLSGCAGQISYGVYGGDAGYPPHLHDACQIPLPKSYSVSSTTTTGSSYVDDDDLRHLIRASSANSITGKRINQSEVFRQQQPAPEQLLRAGGVQGGVGWSQSVGPKIGRIDEEEPSEFGDEMNLRMEFYPRRRRNIAVTRKSPLGNPTSLVSTERN